MRLLLLVLALTGCRALPELEPDTCGNGVIEPSEDCDLFADSALGERLVCRDDCRYQCDRMDPAAPICPAGWFCGTDQICRQASAALEHAPGSPLSLDASDLIVADMDGDGIDDLVGGSGDRIEVRYGVGDGTYREPSQLLMDFPLGRRGVADLDQDGINDLFVPYSLGINVFAGDRGRRLIPNAYPPFDFALFQDPSLRDLRIVAARTPFEPDSFGGLGIVTVSEFEPGDQTLLLAGLSSVAVGQTATIAALQVSELGGSPDFDNVVVAVSAAENAAAPSVFVFDLDSDRVTGIAVPAPVRRDGLMVTDLDGDGLNDVLALLEDGRLIEARQQNGFAPETPPRSAALGTPLAAAGDAGQLHVLVAEGVLTSTGAAVAFRPTYQNPLAPFARGAAGDFNDDGRADIAAASDQARNVVFLISAGAVFNRFEVATTLPPEHLVSGDYDGDGVDDLAFIEPTESGDELRVIFGSRSGPPSDPIFMSRLTPRVRGMRAGRAISPVPPNNDGLDDLIIDLGDPTLAAPSLSALLVGTGRRRMHSPVLVPDSDPYAVVAGRFALDPDDAPDLAVLTLRSELGVVPNAGEGRFAPLVVDESPESERLDTPECGFEPEDFSSRCASMVVGDVVEGGAEELLVASRGQGCLRPDAPARLALVRLSPGVSTCQPLTLPAPERTLGLLRHLLVDVDQDGHLDLLLLFGVPNPRLLVMFGTGQDASGFTDGMLDVELPAAIGRPLDVTPFGAGRLAVLTDRGAATGALQGRSLSPLVLQAEETLPVQGSHRIRRAQVDGDGLDDLVFGTGDRLYLYKGVEKFLGDSVGQ